MSWSSKLKKREREREIFFFGDCTCVFYNEESCRTIVGWGTYPYLSNFLLESIASTTNTQLSPNVVTTVGVSNPQDGIVPIASLFSSLDVGQTVTAPKRMQTPLVPTRRTASNTQVDIEKEQTTK